jgi:hypothetical protein
MNEMKEYFYDVTIKYKEGEITRELSAEAYEEENSKYWIERFVKNSYEGAEIIKMELIRIEQEVEKKESIKFIDSTTVYGEIINGNIGNGKFMLNKIFGKNLSLGYWNAFDKEKLGTLINELQQVYNRLDVDNNER